MSKRRVITLVHGTFDRNAQWTQPESQLRSELSKCLPGDTEFKYFDWSGDNSHRARLMAASRLRRQVEDTIVEFPDADHFIIAHSHGGNVAFYAFRDDPPSVRSRLSGIICMATPFIHCDKRDLSWASFAMVVIAIAFVVLIGLVFIIPMFVCLVIGWPIILGLCCFDVFARFFKIVLQLPSIVMTPLLNWLTKQIEKVSTWADTRQEAIVRHLHLPSRLSCPVFCVAVRLDEAGWWLSALGRATGMTTAAWSLNLRLFAITSLLTATASTLYVFYILTVGWYIGHESPPTFWATAVFTFTMLGWIVHAVFTFVAAFPTLGAGWVSSVVRSSTRAFGPESFEYNLLTRIHTHSTPPTSVEFTKETFPVPRALWRKEPAHCKVYTHLPALHKMVSWISQPHRADENIDNRHDSS